RAGAVLERAGYAAELDELGYPQLAPLVTADEEVRRVGVLELRQRRVEAALGRVADTHRWLREVNLTEIVCGHALDAVRPDGAQESRDKHLALLDVDAAGAWRTVELAQPKRRDRNAARVLDTLHGARRRSPIVSERASRAGALLRTCSLASTETKSRDGLSV